MCRIQLRLLSIAELWSFDCVFMYFFLGGGGEGRGGGIIYILVHAITHSEFSLDDVLGTRMDVPPF